MHKLPLLLSVAIAAFGSPPNVVEAQTHRPVEEVTSFWSDDGWTVHSRTLWTYDRPGGEARVALSQSWDVGAWVDASRERWALDADGRQASGTVEAWSDGAWAEQGTMAFTYDAEGRKVAALRRQWSESALSNADSLASTYRDGLEAERRFFRWQDGAWTEVLRQTSAYDADGNERTRTHAEPGPEGWTEQRRWTFTYAGGRLASSLVERKEDEAWAPWLDQTYTYDAEGRPVGIVHEEWDGEGWVPMMRTETRYAPAP